MPSLWNGIELIEDKKTESLYKNILVTAFEITDVYSRIWRKRIDRWNSSVNQSN